MKKIIVSAFALAIASTAAAQITQGSLLLGLDFGFGSQKNDYSSTMGSTTTITDKTEYSSWWFNPNGQYFLADNLSAGLGFSIGSSKWRNEDPQSKDFYEQTNKNFGLNIFARKYFDCAENFLCFGELNLGISNSNGESEDFDNSTSTTTKYTNEGRSKNGALNFGIMWKATPRLYFQGHIGVLGVNMYNNRNNINAAGDNYSRVKGNNFNFYLSTGNLPFALGFVYNITGGE